VHSWGTLRDDSDRSLLPRAAVAVAAWGQVLIHDRRAELLDNTLESPATESASVGTCPMVPKTFLNLDNCVPSAGGCSSIAYTSTVVTLNETTVGMFYELGGIFVCVCGKKGGVQCWNNTCNEKSSIW